MFGQQKIIFLSYKSDIYIKLCSNISLELQYTVSLQTINKKYRDYTILMFTFFDGKDSQLIYSSTQQRNEP